MAVRQTSNNVYGFTTPIAPLFPFPIVSNRAPSTNDFAPIGTQWVNKPANEIYFLSSIEGNQANWVTVAGGAGNFETLTVEGFTSIAETNTSQAFIGIGTSNQPNEIDIGSLHPDAKLLLYAGENEGISLSAGGNVSIFTLETAAAAYTAELNALAGRIRLTGQTLAAGATQDITITNSWVDLDACGLVTVSNLGSNDAKITVERVQWLAGSLVISVINNGTQALNGDIKICFWIFS